MWIAFIIAFAIVAFGVANIDRANRLESECIGTEWFEGCQHKDELTQTEENQNAFMD